ncbi:hypothetical protein GH733_019398, partial [Mirounga leonina]
MSGDRQAQRLTECSGPGFPLRMNGHNGGIPRAQPSKTTEKTQLSGGSEGIFRERRAEFGLMPLQKKMDGTEDFKIQKMDVDPKEEKPIKNIKWVTHGEFTAERGRKQIEEFIL